MQVRRNSIANSLELRLPCTYTCFHLMTSSWNHTTFVMYLTLFHCSLTCVTTSIGATFLGCRAVHVSTARFHTRASRTSGNGGTKPWKRIYKITKQLLLNALRQRENGRHFSEECIYLHEECCILIRVSLKFVPKGPINHMPALVQIMPGHRAGDKPLSELVMT